MIFILMKLSIITFSTMKFYKVRLSITTLKITRIGAMTISTTIFKYNKT